LYLGHGILEKPQNRPIGHGFLSEGLLQLNRRRLNRRRHDLLGRVQNSVGRLRSRRRRHENGVRADFADHRRRRGFPVDSHWVGKLKETERKSEKINGRTFESELPSEH